MGVSELPILLLQAAARRGRWVLPAGLVAGAALPGAAATMRDVLPVMVTGLLILSAFRIGARRSFGSRADFRRALGLIAVIQFAIPMVAAAICGLAGLNATPMLAAFVLVLAGASISGSPNLAAMCGRDPAPALRLLLFGTVLLPLTVFPVFALWPELLGGRDIHSPILRLVATIAGAGIVGFAARRLFAARITPRIEEAVDGLSAILLAVMVVGLMAAVGPALRHDQLALAGWLAYAFVVNFGLQVAMSLVLRRTRLAGIAAPVSIVAGNRNIALFLVALPPEVTGPLLLFIGCYQIPMYLTPLLLGWSHRGGTG